MSQGAKIDPPSPHIACWLVIKKYYPYGALLGLNLTYAIYGKLSNPSVLPDMKFSRSKSNQCEWSNRSFISVEMK